MRTTKVIGWAAALLAVAACSSSSDTSDQSTALTQVTTGDVNAIAVATNCGATPSVTLDGKISLGRLGVRLTFRNNEKGTHENVQDLTSDVILLPVGHVVSSIGAPKNPYVWIQVVDGNGIDVSGEVFLGRCADGLANLTTTAPIVATAHLDVEHCDNTGPSVDVSGRVTLSPLTIRVIFRDSLEATTNVVVMTQTDPVVVPLGVGVTISKQPSRGGVGGNPWIYAQFIDGTGTALGPQSLLGRCVQLEH